MKENILVRYLEGKLSSSHIEPITKEYLIGVFSKFKEPSWGLPHESIVLLFIDASSSYNFVKLQNLGDWILFQESFYKTKNRDINIEFGKRSFDQCFKMTRRQIRVYEELADNLQYIIDETSKNLLIDNKK